MDERAYARYMSDIAYFHSRLEASPGSKYFIPLALSYNKLEKYDETIQLCRPAVEKSPSDCAAKVLLAEAYVFKGEFERAKELLYEVVTEDDGNYLALKLLGIIFKSSDEGGDALRYLKAAYIRAPEDPELKIMIEDLGGSVDPGELLEERSQRNETGDGEKDEDSRTYSEIERKIRNAEEFIADLVSDASIMGSKQSGMEEAEELIEAEASEDVSDLEKEIPEERAENEVSDEELEKLFNSRERPMEEETSEKDENSSYDNDKENSSGSGDFISEDEIDSPGESGPEEENLADLLGALSHDESGEEEPSSEDLINALAADFHEDDAPGHTEDLAAVLAQETETSDDIFSEDEEPEEEEGLVSALEDISEPENIPKSHGEDSVAAILTSPASEEIEAALVAMKNFSGKPSEASFSDDEKISAGALSNPLPEENTLAVSPEIHALYSKEAEEKELGESDTNSPETGPSEEKTGEGETPGKEGFLSIISQKTGESLNDFDFEGLAPSDEEEGDYAEENDGGEKSLLPGASSDKPPQAPPEITFEDIIGDDDFDFEGLTPSEEEEEEIAPGTEEVLKKAPEIDLGESAPFAQRDIMDEILNASGMDALASPIGEEPVGKELREEESLSLEKLAPSPEVKKSKVKKLLKMQSNLNKLKRERQ